MGVAGVSSPSELAQDFYLISHSLWKTTPLSPAASLSFSDCKGMGLKINFFPKRQCQTSQGQP